MASHEGQEGRRAHRVAAAFRVRYRTVDELVVALTQDLSRGGLFMRTERFLPVNAIVRVHLDLPDGGGQLPVICRVAFVRSPDEAAAQGKSSGMGVEFLDLGPERLAELERFVAERVPEAKGAAPRRALDIVVADDDETIRGPVTRALRERGDHVREAPDGLAALGACLRQVPDLVLSDVQMPRMDGWHLVRMLRARPSLMRVPIVLLTTLTDDEARLTGYRLGVDDFIGKPVRDDELLLRVDRVMARMQKGGHERRSLRGDLEHVTLPSLLSFLALEQKTGVLLLVGEASARVHLRAGQPLRVEVDETPVAGPDDPALAALLDWTRGQFEFAASEVSCADELQTSVTALLLEHARRSDERGR